MRHRNIWLLMVFTIMAVLHIVPVSAQQMQLPTQAAPSPIKPKVDQFPSFVQMTSTDKDGTQTVMRCGYSASNNQAVIIDPEFHEISIVNPEKHIYTRIQHVGDIIIATYMPPNGQGLVLELVKADGSVITKNCKGEMNNDTISNCTPAQAMSSTAEIRDSDQKITPQCSDLLQSNKADIKAALADPQQAQTFKAGFTQKINVLESP